MLTTSQDTGANNWWLVVGGGWLVVGGGRFVVCGWLVVVGWWLVVVVGSGGARACVLPLGEH